LSGALIVAAEMGQPDFGWLEGLRRAHYPPERNRVPAHLTMFHALPPSAESEARSRLAAIAKAKPPRATIDGLIDLGGGIAFRVVSPDLDQIRGDLAEELHGLLGTQDSGGWRPHVTIQNKVVPSIAKLLLAQLGRDFRAREVELAGLASWWYRGGPWEQHSRHMFA